MYVCLFVCMLDNKVYTGKKKQKKKSKTLLLSGRLYLRSGAKKEALFCC